MGVLLNITKKYFKDDLAKTTFKEDNLGQHLSDYDNEEYKCEIDGNEYLVYINEH